MFQLIIGILVCICFATAMTQAVDYEEESSTLEYILFTSSTLRQRIASTITSTTTVPTITSMPAQEFDTSAVIEVKQWKVGKSAESIPLGNFPNKRTCLISCQLPVNCRFVSYNKDTRECVGYTRWASPRFSPDSSSSLLTTSDKRMAEKSNTDYSGYDIMVEGEFAVSLAIRVPPETCAQLCIIHPRCVAVTLDVNNPNCYLKHKMTLTPRINAVDAVSYVIVE